MCWSCHGRSSCCCPSQIIVTNCSFPDHALLSYADQEGYCSFPLLWTSKCTCKASVSVCVIWTLFICFTAWLLFSIPLCILSWYWIKVSLLIITYHSSKHQMYVVGMMKMQSIVLRFEERSICGNFWLYYFLNQIMCVVYLSSLSNSYLKKDGMVCNVIVVVHSFKCL